MKYKRLLFISILMLLFGVTSHAEYDGYIVKFNTVPDELDPYIFEEIHAPTGVYAVDNLDCLKGLEEYIEVVEENEVVKIEFPTEPLRLFSLPDDELYPSQWSVQMINADYAWQHETYGNEIRVGVIDSGCYEHDDLSGNLITGWNFLTKTENTSDNIGHGTHVSGIIAASMNSQGTVGVAPKAKIVPLKCFDKTQDPTVKNLADAIYAAVDDYGCKVINMSWGLTGNISNIKAAIDYAAEKGVILIAAAGNKNTTTLNYPAAYENVIGVASVNIDKTKSWFSQYNNSVFISAPGNDIESTSNANGYISMNGTSQAAPHISGIAALVLSADESITPEQFANLLKDTAEDLGAEGYDTTFGYGLADTKAIMDKMFESIPYYVSPVNKSGDKNYVLIKNNTSNLLSCESLFAAYEDGRFTGLIKTPVGILSGKSIIVSTDKSDTAAHFLWDSMIKMKPVSKKR